MVVTGKNLNEFKNNEGVLLLAFKAGWCGPCRMLSPVLEEIDNENDNITVGSVDVDSNEEMCIEYGIKNVPTTFILKNGEVVSKIIGAKSKAEILKTIDDLG